METALSEDESCIENDFDPGFPDYENHVDDKLACSPSSGGPFSALTASMWPQDILSKLGQLSDDPNCQPDFRFDEFGFRVEEEDGPEQSSSKLLSIPFTEDPQHRWVPS